MILLLGGTSESLVVADWLTAHHHPFILSVTTDYGEELAQEHAQQVVQQVLQPADFQPFFTAHDIDQIIDATHPFARVISTEAMAQAAAAGIDYLRFERGSVFDEDDNVHVVASFDEAVRYLKTTTGMIYLSTGSKTAPDYATALGLDRLHVRVLPTTSVMEKLTAAGFDATQIDGIRGPFSKALNVALFQRVHAQVVVTKESGKQGGVQEKIAAATQLGIPVVIIRRPTLVYPAQVTSIDELATYLEGA